ncbi:hypothetical protein EG834_20795, partial [bacterium]|nr:hypothetical protein [bacterium]
MAILAGWIMSHEAWKNGIVWNNDYAFTQNPERSGLHGMFHEQQYEFNKALFGESFAKSEWVQTLTFSALSQQLSNWIFGTQSVRSNAIQGLFTDNGFSGSSVRNMHKGGGWFGSSRDWQEFAALPEGFDAAFDGMYQTIKGSLLDLGLLFSDNTLAAKLTNFRMSVYSITDGKSFNQVAIEVSDSLLEQMGRSLFPSIDTLKKTASADGKTLAENWNQAFTRITQESLAVSRVVSLMGDTMSSVFGQNNTDGILKASDGLVQLFGTIDSFNSSFNAYYSNFYTGYEQVTQAWKDMAAGFTDIGITDMPTTRAQFRALVDSLDLNTEGGRSTFKSLMSLQG